MVDDSLINIKVAQKILEHEGIKVYSVLSGKACLENVKDNTYDIIFMDIMMPEMDGVETMQKLKNIEGFCTPIVALTADAQGDAKAKYLSLGFDGYIAKPIIIDELKNTLKQININ
ncbi:MAG: response regulator [Bacilli bacterium]